MQANVFHVREILRSYSIRPTKRKGQHFIVNPEIAKKQITYAGLSPKDLVFEIGAGLGGLTETIANRGNSVIAIEIDERLIRLLRARFGGQSNISVIRADVLSFNPRQVDKIISNIPYSISSQITFKVLELQFTTAILTYQIDFAKRMVAQPGSRDYSRLSVNVYYRAEAEILDRIPRDAFHPVPSVDSAFIRLKRRKPPFFVIDEEFFFELLRAFFPYRNQFLRKVLKRFLRVKGLENLNVLEIIRNAEVEDVRIRDICPESFAKLANEIRHRLNHPYQGAQSHQSL
jgi:16S rRNA (adenine1518-N6/adenine1519-N6)-dimethyltransferase